MLLNVLEYTYSNILLSISTVRKHGKKKTIILLNNC